MSILSDVTRAAPAYHPRPDEERSRPRRKIRSQQLELATRSLLRGVTSSSLHGDEVLSSTQNSEESTTAITSQATVYAYNTPEFNEGHYAQILTADEVPAIEVVPSAPAAPSAEESLADKKSQIIAVANQNQWNQVLTLCTNALVAHPRDLELIEIKGYAHFGLGQWTEAMQCGDQILSEQSEHQNATWLKNTSLKKRADNYLSEQSWQEASTDYSASLGSGVDADIVRKLSVCYGHLQQWENSLRCFKHLVDQNGEQDINVWRQIGFCCQMRRQAETPFLEGEAEFAREACLRLIAVPEYSRDPAVWQLGFLATSQIQRSRTPQ